MFFTIWKKTIMVYKLSLYYNQGLKNIKLVIFARYRLETLIFQYSVRVLLLSTERAPRVQKPSLYFFQFQSDKYCLFWHEVGKYGQIKFNYQLPARANSHFSHYFTEAGQRVIIYNHNFGEWKSLMTKYVCKSWTKKSNRETRGEFQFFNFLEINKGNISYAHIGYQNFKCALRRYKWI